MSCIGAAQGVSKAKRPRGAVYLRRHGSDAYFFFPAFGLVLAAGFFGAVFFMTDLQKDNAHGESTLGKRLIWDNPPTMVMHRVI